MRSVRSILALARAAFLTGTSYRLATALQFVGLLASVVPLYFIAGALQPVVEESIAREGGNYFGFLMLGVATTYVYIAALSAVPAAIAGGLGSGTLEALFVTKASTPAILAGMSAYPLARALLSAGILVVGATLIGVEVTWQGLPVALAGLALLIIAYGAIGVVAAALVLVFRTSGPLLTAVITGSGLLGGVYYSTSVIPAWLQDLSAIVPLTYALRAMRMAMLDGAPLSDVRNDLVMMLVITTLIAGFALAAFSWALRHARRAGTLAQY